ERDIKPADKLALDSLVHMAQRVLNQRAGVAEALMAGDNAGALSAILQVGTSAGGARPKAVIGINKARTEIRSGQVTLPDGFEHFLLKFDGVVESTRERETFGDPQGFGRMEYAYYLMAKDAGIDMSYCELLEEGERAHFMTKRFDRVGNRKIHYQSLCAMDHADYKQPGAYSYEQLFALMRKLRLTREQALQMYRRMVFNIVARNHDDHTKNFAFILNTENRWQLAPAFDVAFSYKPGSPWVNAHQLSLNGKRDNFTREDLLVPAQTFYKEAVSIINEVTDTVATWPRYAERAGVFTEFAKQIGKAHRLSL
ncbi:MAG TPA: HipA domain-containing protein, partial [Cellvibrionaceae bacterium]